MTDLMTCIPCEGASRDGAGGPVLSMPATAQDIAICKTTDVVHKNIVRRRRRAQAVQLIELSIIHLPVAFLINLLE
jgi:hypothetical protein